ncbi:MAG: hypothetical protein ACRD1F_03050, partial [Terriglobales bacterium]
ALLRPEGQRVEVDQEQILAGYFVDEFVRDEELMRAAPRGAVALPGIRMRCRTLDHQTREGLLASDLLGLHEGLELTAPYAECRWQRLYVPRRALEYLAVVGVVRAARQRRQAPQAQISLFSPGGQR